MPNIHSACLHWGRCIESILQHLGHLVISSWTTAQWVYELFQGYFWTSIRASCGAKAARRQTTPSLRPLTTASKAKTHRNDNSYTHAIFYVPVKRVKLSKAATSAALPPLSPRAKWRLVKTYPADPSRQQQRVTSVSCTPVFRFLQGMSS